MKRIRFYLCAVLLALSVTAMTACGRNSGNDQSGQPSTAQNSSMGNDTTGSADTGKLKNGSESGSARESTGVLDGLADDVEQGLHDMEGDSEGPGSNADESGK